MATVWWDAECQCSLPASCEPHIWPWLGCGCFFTTLENLLAGENALKHTHTHPPPVINAISHLHLNKRHHALWHITLLTALWCLQTYIVSPQFVQPNCCRLWQWQRCKQALKLRSGRLVSVWISTVHRGEELAFTLFPSPSAGCQCCS